MTGGHASGQEAETTLGVLAIPLSRERGMLTATPAPYTRTPELPEGEG
ncbi:hypothetical protein [Microbulbifer halophilus]